MSPNERKAMNKAIQAAHADWSEEDRRVVNAATFSLNFGPIPEGEEPDGDGWKYPGDGVAYDRARELSDELPSQLWYNVECGELTDTEPCAWTDEETGETFEPGWSDWCALNAQEIRAAVFGKDFANNILRG